jgi:hypothetical protein
MRAVASRVDLHLVCILQLSASVGSAGKMTTENTPTHRMGA